MREGGVAGRIDRLGSDRRRVQKASGRVEDDRSGQEEPVGIDLAAVPRRVRSLLHASRSASRHHACRTRRRARGDLRRARSHLRRRGRGRRGRVGPRRQTCSRPFASFVGGGSRRLPREASTPTAPGRSMNGLPSRSPRVMARWPAVFSGSDLDPDANRKRMESIVRRIEELAGSLAGPAAAAADDGVDARDAPGDHVERSAGGEHDRRESRRRQPLARRGGRGPSGPGQPVAHRPCARADAARARRSLPAREPTHYGTRRNASGRAVRVLVGAGRPGKPGR